MTRRVAIAILSTVWTVLIVGSVIAYWTTRSVLLADLDRELVARATSLPEVRGGMAQEGPLPLHDGDRYLIINERGQTVGRSGLESAVARDAEVTEAGFVRLPDGPRLRRIALRITRPPADLAAAVQPVTVVFSGSAAAFDRVLSRLGLVLLILVIASSAAATWVAVRVSRAALRPLESTAQVIGSIDDRTLQRRIEVRALPTELHAMAERLNEMLARLERATNARQQFMADASHELRTPVAALVTALEVSLRRPRDDAAMRQVMQDCLGDARLLRELVECLLEQVKSERATADAPDVAILLADVVEECVRVVAPLAAERQLTMQHRIPHDLLIRTQYARFRSVLLNLLSNAVEYNRTGGTIDLTAAIATDDRLELNVRDTGPGIAAEHLSRLFEPFYRLDAARTGQAGGHLGLGLFLVQSHLRAMGGQCDVSSEVGVGTTFRITLPAERVAQRTVAHATARTQDTVLGES